MKLVHLIGLCFSFGSWQVAAYDMNTLEETALRQNVGSIEELLPHLPEDLRRNFALQHTSRGLQKGSFENPRVFLFGLDGKFVVTFNGGDPSQGGHDTLEVLQFNDREKKFDLFEASFQERRLVVDKNPAKCMGCHTSAAGRDIHPIFTDYPKWPGFFGSDHDAVNRVPEEETAITTFNTQTRPAHPRYKNLLYHPTQVGQNAAPFYRVSRFGYENMPNLRLMDYLHWLNGQRLTAHFRSHPEYKKLLPLLAYFSIRNNSTLNANDPLVQAQFTAEEFKGLRRSLHVLFGRMAMDPERLEITKKEFFDLYGLSPGDMNMGLGEGRDFLFNLGLVSGEPDYVNADVLNDFVRHYPNSRLQVESLFLNDIVAGIINTPLEKAFANTIDSYGAIAVLKPSNHLGLILAQIKSAFP